MTLFSAQPLINFNKLLILVLSYFAVFFRLDSLIGLFGAGCQPNSSNDPFGLRRISYGLVSYMIVKLLLDQLVDIITMLALFCIGPTVGGKG